MAIPIKGSLLTPSREELDLLDDEGLYADG